MRRDPFRFLDAAALGCLGSCGFFVDAWGLRLVLAQCFHPSGGVLRWVVVSFGVLWGLSFCLLPPGGHFPDRRSCFQVFGCRFGVFWRGTFCLWYLWFGPPFCWAVAVWVSSACCGYFVWTVKVGPQPAEYGAELSPDFSRRCPEAGVGKGLTGRA